MKLFFDIETIPDQREGAIDRAAALVKVPANYKKQEIIDKYRLDNAVETHAKTALKGLYGEICSIAWAIDDLRIEAITRDSEMSEASILTHFFTAIENQAKNGEGHFQDITWIGHNVIDFDLRFLKQRALVNNTRSPFIIPADARHGKSVFDTMKEWAGWKGYVKLDELCEVFGFEGKGDIDGSMVGELWATGQYDVIHDYNKHDIEMTRNVYKRMIYENAQ